MADYSLEQVGFALKTLGHYRVVRAQEVANEGAPDGISGARMIALGLRETGCRNVNGGAVYDKAAMKWVEAPPEEQDDGWLQISRVWHRHDLERMPGVKAGTWGPVIPGVSAASPGYCPRFTDALRWTIDAMHEAIAYAEDHGVIDTVRFATAAHNAGIGGALNGYNDGNVDRYTVYGDYSTWVEHHRKIIKRWLETHPGWH